jgi:hypothetical protein
MFVRLRFFGGCRGSTESSARRARIAEVPSTPASVRVPERRPRVAIFAMILGLIEDSCCLIFKQQTHDFRGFWKRMKGLEPSTFCMANESSVELGERRNPRGRAESGALPRSERETSITAGSVVFRGFGHKCGACAHVRNGHAPAPEWGWETTIRVVPARAPVRATAGTVTDSPDGLPPGVLSGLSAVAPMGSSGVASVTQRTPRATGRRVWPARRGSARCRGRPKSRSWSPWWSGCRSERSPDERRPACRERSCSRRPGT